MPVRCVIQDGDSVIKLSEQYGFAAQTIWDDSANASLKKSRPDMNVLVPGDVVVIPDKKVKQEKRPTGKRHKFRRKGIPALFRLQLFDGDAPRKNQDYSLTVAGQELDGTTDDQGVLEQYVPATASEGQLVIGPEQARFTLKFGFLQPASELAGVQRRLTNMGYVCDNTDGDMTDQTSEAIMAFQAHFGLPQTGELDDATRDKLEHVHDDVSKFDLAG
jgi:Putative peptidoglycan binding domain